ncbi:hypothetical protein BWZ20_01845 [Winogradskyella sp. J14-2]|uniref:S41 family peptidase n=1 Tax=Winogradskyella sp. J14-2 TaxID=1936080 RepID=UPI000972DD37|nr:S41 family peptidase [Winogradskyella sp. J14-2]APY07120.1 hypothetical protein BWZ20_01845 [Winogradskyella sp. J14-2]
MKNLVIAFTVISISFASALWSQSPQCDCKADLDFIIEKLKKTPSYNKQIKNAALDEFNQTYQNLTKDLDSTISIIDCYKRIQDLITTVNDFHFNLYFNYKDEKSYLGRYSEDEISRLHKSLKSVNSKSIEGIYKLGKTEIKVGIKHKNKNIIEGFVLSSNDSLWQKGDILLVGSKNKFGKYNLTYYKSNNKQLQMLNNISFDNERLMSFKKLENLFNEEFKNDKTSNWEFKELNKDVQYLYMGSFNRNDANKKASKEFYRQIKNKLKAPYIIVDLRSNGGGASKISDPFLKLLKKTKSKIYIITNSFTISNGEQFTLKLKNETNSVHLGQTTFGALAYGSNYGNLYTTPSGYFSFYPTDMDFHNIYYKYEGFGIIPDITLEFDKDWVEQTLDIIKNETQKQ